MSTATSKLNVKADGTIEYQLGPSDAACKSPLSSETWTFVDTETDGLCAPIHVIEIAAQRFQGLTPVGDSFRVFINHGIEISEAAVAIHGYTTEFIKANGINSKEAYTAFRQYVGDSYVAAHYLIFDWDRVLVPELARLGEATIGKRGFCTWFLSRRSLPEFRTHKLDYLRDVFSLKCSGAHSALGDVESVTDLLLRVIFPRLNHAGMEDIYSISDFSRLTPLEVCRQKVCNISIGVEYKKIAFCPQLPDFRLLALQRRQEDKEGQKLLKEAEKALNGSTSYPDLLLDYRMLEDTPDILFKDETFVFTGTMTWGSRSKAEKEIAARGGSMFKRKPMHDIDYLVLGEHPETGWLSRDSGSKLRDAFIYKFTHPGGKLKIIRERDFIAAL
jgi:DNA polymerase III epsilon subunit-like protein